MRYIAVELHFAATLDSGSSMLGNKLKEGKVLIDTIDNGIIKCLASEVSAHPYPSERKV
jgi:hypothetical protein